MVCVDIDGVEEEIMWGNVILVAVDRYNYIVNVMIGKWHVLVQR